MDDIGCNQSYNCFIDFVTKCEFFQDKLHIVEFYFEEFLNLCWVSLQKNPKILINFLLNNDKSLKKWLEIVILKKKKSWVIAFLKLLKEIILIDDENIYVILNEESIKKSIYILFSTFFSCKANMIKSIFLEIFLLIDNNKKQHILVKKF